MGDRATDEDLELLGKLGVETSPEDKAGRSPASSALSPASKRSSDFMSSTGARRSTARASTFSNGFTRSGWTGFGRWGNAARY